MPKTDEVTLDHRFQPLPGSHVPFEQRGFTVYNFSDGRRIGEPVLNNASPAQLRTFLEKKVPQDQQLPVPEVDPVRNLSSMSFPDQHKGIMQISNSYVAVRVK